MDARMVKMRQECSFRPFRVLALLLICMPVTLSAQIPEIQGIVNAYATVLRIDSSGCSTMLEVVSAADFSSGDRALIIQLKGIEIRTSNDSTFGSIVQYGSSGNYEFVTVASVSQNDIFLEKSLLNTYAPAGTVMLVRVPVYPSVRIVGTLTAVPWNGASGGICALEIRDTLFLNASIDLAGAGFQGGAPSNNAGGSNFMEYYCSMSSGNGGQKGEGAAERPPQYEAARGALANGGGGGNNHNAGGGGGGNGGRGGVGGKQHNGAPSLDIGGRGGNSLSYSNAQRKIFPGGGGGGGHQNNNRGTGGENGGGIVILRAQYLAGNNQTIRVNGADVLIEAGNDGAGGGGAGGTVILDVDTLLSPVKIEAMGGKGGDLNNDNNNTQCHGPGGGGGGGIVWVSRPTVDPRLSIDSRGGFAGRNVRYPSPCLNDSYGAGPGETGKVLTDLRIPENTGPSALTARAGPDIAICEDSCAVIFAGASGGKPPYSYVWSPPTGLTSPNDSVTTACPKGTTTYVVTVRDQQGCVALARVTVVVHPHPVPLITQIGDTLIASPNQRYQWYRNDTLIAGATDQRLVIDRDGIYRVQVEDGFGCEGSSLKYPFSRNPLEITASPDREVCADSCANLWVAAQGGRRPYSYSWTPPAGLLTPGDSATRACPTSTTTYRVTVTDGTGNTQTRDVTVIVRPRPPVPVITRSGDTLSTLPASQYQWYRDGVPVPGATGRQYVAILPGTYTVQVFNSFGCFAISAGIVIAPSRLSLLMGNDQDICADSCAVLSAVATGGSPPYTYRWTPPTGLSRPTDSVTIACPPTSTTYTMTITDKIGATVSGQVIVRVLAPPPTPVVARSGDTLISTPASWYQWYRNGAPIPGATGQRHVAILPGSYTVRVYNALGCSSESVPVSVDPGPATTSVALGCPDSTFFDPGATVTLPILLTASQHLPSGGAAHYTAYLRYLRNVLMATGPGLHDPRDAGPERMIALDGTRGGNAETGALGMMEFVAMLGDTICTRVILDSLVWSDRAVSVAYDARECLICVKVCREGGVRLFSSEGKFLLRQNRPNPFNAGTAIDFELIERGTIRLAILDLFGRTVALLADGELEQGTHSVWFDASRLQSGMYLCILQTASQIESRVMMIVK